MSKSDYKRRIRQRRIAWFKRNVPFLLVGTVTVGAIGGGIFYFGSKWRQEGSMPISVTASGTEQTGGKAVDASEDAAFQESSAAEAAAQALNAQVETLLAEAADIAAGYDYDGAIEHLQNAPIYGLDTRITEAVTGYEQTKASLVEYDINQVTHVFFHTLIIDNSKAFDGDSKAGGYNQMMTTKSEFEKILQSMYDRGYVLVRLHDLAYEVTDENGNAKFVKNSILLPEGKKAFVMSQDDVCYYEYMKGDGFATRMIIGEDGKPVCEMELEDGSTVVGDYDLVPILENFIQSHPDFSYKGARAVIAFTGYNGILGYRTAESYSDKPTYQQDRETAAAVAQCLRDNGWELASHSWGHRNMGTIDFADFKRDTDKWEAEVESLIGPTDIILFPFGSDIGDWHPYSSTNDRFNYLKSKGFRYFCNVDSSKYWIQIGEDHLRQGRRNLDGYRMYYDMIETDESKLKLNDLFDVNEVFDQDRPTPVPPMGGG